LALLRFVAAHAAETWFALMAGSALVVGVYQIDSPKGTIMAGSVHLSDCRQRPSFIIDIERARDPLEKSQLERFALQKTLARFHITG
jgi:hypothetical protein